VLLAVLLAGEALAAPESYRGAPVASVLRSLQSTGLQFLFSSDLVPDSLLVHNEPRRRDRLGIAREILAEHDLELRAATATLYVVVRTFHDSASHTLTGRVVDAESKAALAGARVELLPIGQVSWANADGLFAFDKLPAGDYRVSATIDDYAHGEAPVRVIDGRTPRDIRIDLDKAQIDTVVVEASRYALSAEEAYGARRFLGADLAHEPEVAQDPFRAMRRVPGIVQSDLTAASHLRGGETGEVMVLFDGFPLRQVYHLPGYLSPISLLDESLIGSIDAYTGGFPARYGNRLSGVFDVDPVEEIGKVHAKVGLSFIDARARISAATETDEYVANVRHGTLREVLDSFSLDTGQPTYTDAYLATSHRFETGFKLRGNLFWSEDEYRVDDDDEQARIRSRTRYAWLHGEYPRKKRVSGSFSLGVSDLDLERNGTLDKPELAVGAVDDVRNAVHYDFRGELNWQFNERSRLTTGLEWNSGNGEFEYAGATTYSPALAELYGVGSGFTRTIATTPTQQIVALYLSQRVQMGRWTPEVGVRVQDIQMTGRERQRSWDPRVGLRVELQPRTMLRAHWGRFYQYDEIQDLALPDGETVSAPAQSSDHWILGLEQQFTAGVQLRAEIYRKDQSRVRPRYENLMGPLEVLYELTPDRVRIAPVNARFSGAELSVAVERESWRAWTALSWARADDEVGTGDVPRSWEQLWSASAGVDWHSGPWRLGAVATVHTCWPYTPVDIDLAGDATLGTRNSARFSNYGTLDLRAEYRRPMAYGSLAVVLNIANATNRKNRCCTDVEVDDEDPLGDEIVAEKKYWPRMLPVLSVEWEF
jgi:hypothetical protein